MTPQEFDVALASALRICRDVAKEALPIEEMLEYVRVTPYRNSDESWIGLTPEDLVAVETVLELLGDIAEIGASLPPEPAPIRVPEAPEGGAVPLPTNLLKT